MASAPLFLDRVMETSTTTGSGTYTLAGALTGFQAFSVVGNGNSCYYGAIDVDANGNPTGNWEVGRGTYTSSGTTLSRDSVLASSSGGSAVNWAAGTRRVFLDFPAVRAEPKLRTVTAATDTVTADDGTVLYDCTSNAITVTLPAAAGRGSNPLRLKKTDNSANAVTIQRNGTPGTDTIDGATNIVINAQYGARVLVSDKVASFYVF